MSNNKFRIPLLFTMSMFLVCCGQQTGNTPIGNTRLDSTAIVSSTPYMKSTFPFQVTSTPNPPIEMHNRHFWIQAPVGEIEGYYELFEKYGYGGNGPSWVEHIYSLLKQQDPTLIEHLEFDEEADTFLVYANSEETVSRFMQVVIPVFGTKKTLEKYLKQANPNEFSE